MALLLATALVAPGAGAEPQQVSGALAAGGRFQFVVPEGWSAGDALILYNRGFTLRSDVLEEDPRLAPDEVLVAEWLRRGYAVAAGSYAQRGWAVFDAGAHQRAVLERFIDQAGAPGRIVLVGGSLGGLVSVLSAEDFVAAGQPVHGIYALCPAFAGARTWDRAADLKLVYDAVCAGVGGGEIDRGSSAPAWVLDYAQVPYDWGDQADPEVQRLAARLLQCTGVFLPAWARSSGQQQRLDTIMATAGITDVDFFITNMAYSTFALSDLVRGPDKLRGASPFDNMAVDYGDPALDAAVQRVQADPYARAELSVLSDPQWRIGQARLLALHTSRDEIVIPEHLALLQPLAKSSAHVATALVEEDAPSHCGFSDAEFVAGFDALEAWMDGAAEPTPDTLNARCAGLAGLLEGGDTRCRFADASGLARYDARVAPRALPEHAPVAAPQSGAWYDPTRDGEGFFLQVLPGGDTAAVSWYTYAADGSGTPHWIVGLGIVRGNAVLVQDAASFRGGGFGQAFDPDTVESTHWGRLTFLIEQPLAAGTTLRRGRVRYEGPDGWGSGERLLTQITRDGCGAGCDPAALPLHGYSGLWFRGNDAPGDGLFFQVDDTGMAVVAWYLFAPDGSPLWLTGVTTGTTAAGVEFQLVGARGAQFGDDFDADAVQRSVWGTAVLEFADCDSATLRWQARDPAFADGAIALTRLTAAAPGSVCDRD